MTSQESFVTRLRRHRERSRVSLAEIAELTRIKQDLFEAFERNDVSEWPAGLYARAYIRAYASVVGLDPDDTVDEFCRLFPRGDRRVQSTMREIAAIVASPSEWHDEFGLPIDRRQTPAVNVLTEPPYFQVALARIGSNLRALWMWARRAQAPGRLVGSRRQTS